MQNRFHIGWLVVATLTQAAVMGQDDSRPILRLPNSSIPLSPKPAGSDVTAFDKPMLDAIKELDLVGASLAVTLNGRLIVARGYGYADLEHQRPVEPTSLFRIASISKPITAAAILRLVQTRKLRLDEKVQDLLKVDAIAGDENEPDARFADITIRHLLNHSGGWEREVDPTGDATRHLVRQSLGLLPEQYKPDHLVQYMFGQPLDFEPGAKFAYSNFGYCALGRIVEKVSGQSYEVFVKQNVLAPLGITEMYIGQRNTREDEVSYYSRAAENDVSVRGQFVDVSGDAAVETYDSFGGWIASSVDLARFASAFDDPRQCRILSQSGVEAMLSRPSGPLGIDESGAPRSDFYAFGWEVRLSSQGRTTFHSGSLKPGSYTMLYRRRDGISWVLLCNVRTAPNDEQLRDAFQTPLHRAADEVMKSRPPDRLDLFKLKYPPSKSSL